MLEGQQLQELVPDSQAPGGHWGQLRWLISAGFVTCTFSSLEETSLVWIKFAMIDLFIFAGVFEC